MPNPVKDAWKQGRAVVNGWLSIPSGFAAEMMAKGGFDALTVDMQHGVQDYMSAVSCFQAIQSHPVVPMVRVPWNEPGIIGKVLDAGAMGVICPMVNTAAEAKALVDACRYPPIGMISRKPSASATSAISQNSTPLPEATKAMISTSSRMPMPRLTQC